MARRREQIVVNPKLKKAFEFFLEHSGYVHGRREQGALDLARAEAIAEALGWEVEWEPDEEEYQTDLEGDQPDEVLSAILYDDDGVVIGSLGGIGDPDKNYVRLVEAELASEALYERGLL